MQHTITYFKDMLPRMLKLDILITLAGINTSLSWIVNTSSITDTLLPYLKKKFVIHQ